MAKKVPVTSVTPAIKVKATSKAKQASTRKMVGAIAAATPVGRVVKTAATAAKAAGTAAKAVKATKAAKTTKSSRQAYDYPVSGKSANKVIPNVGKAKAEYRYGKDMDISENVKIKNAVSPSGRTTSRGGALQVERENFRTTSLKYSNAEAKANARGLKAANKPTKAGKVQKKITSTRKMEDVPKGVSNRVSDTLKRLAAEESKKKGK
jgi:DNA-binding protein HU-beta